MATTSYKVLSGLDTSDEKRFEADTIVTDKDLLPIDLEAYLEMGAIEEIVPEATAEDLMKLTKPKLLELAASRGIDVPADNNKDEIVAKLLA